MPNDFKRASWLELFYDVAFVALIAQLTYLAAAHHHTIVDVFNIVVVGYTIFIAWWATTANRNLQPSETSADKLFIQFQMVGAFLMSLTMPGVFEGSYLGFFMTLAAVRFLQAFMVVRMYMMHPKTRPVTYNMLEGFIIGAGVWVAAAITPMPYHFVVVIAALAIDILTPLTRGRGNTRRYLNVYHLQERLGLFLMLVVGESMIVVALANTATSLSAVEPSVLLSGLGLMIALWWLYFEHSDRHIGLRPKNLFLFLHSHGFLFGSIIFLSVGYKLIIANTESPAGFLFVVAGIVGMTITLSTIRIALYGTTRRALLLTSIVALPGVLIAGYGLYTGHVLSALGAFTIWYLFIAYIDLKGVFKKARREPLNPAN